VNKSASTFVFWGCVVLSVIGFAYSIRIGAQFRAENNILMDDGLQSARGLAEEARSQIAAALEDVSEKTETAAEQLFIRGEPDRPDLLRVIRGLVYSDPGFVEAGIGFAPFAYDPQIRLYGFSYSVDDYGMHFHDLDAKQDYTQLEASWYHGPMKGMPVWLEPQYDEKRQQMLVTYAVPLFDPQRSTDPVGVIFATYAVSRLQRVFDAMDLGANGYAFLLSSTEHFLLHPNSDYIQNRRTLDDVRGHMITNQAAAAETLDDALRDPSRTVRFTDADTGMYSRVFFSHPILPAAWTLGVVLVDQDLLLPPAAAHAKQIRFALLFALAVVVLTVPLSGALRGSTLGLWVLSLVFSVCCIFVYGFALWLAMHQPAVEGPELLRITNRNVLNKFMSDQRHRTLAQREEVPLFVPAGIYVQSIAFENASDVGITGYVWQRYTDRIHDHVVRGFEMAESESFNRQEPHTMRSGNVELVRWSFKATLPQQLDYSRYPIGRQNVSIRLWHKQFTENIILIPDLGSYTLLNPAANPGMLKGLTLGGWNIKGSFFDYRFEKYQTSFGLTDSAGLTDFPELYFNITIEKAITGPMISNILPLVVIFILLSTILYLSSRLEAQVTVITACASFFLIVVFSHIGLRQSLATDTIVYLEYFYFTTYVMILYVTLNYIFWTSAEAEIAQSSDTDAPQISPFSRFVHYRNNLIPKLLFWPASQLALLVLTLLTFD
jgi:hypothetical protein